MITKKDFQRMKGSVCPYGRHANIGDKQCMNCKFHHIKDEYCSGEVDTVRKHIRFLKPDF